jgi:hypothetical protein
MEDANFATGSNGLIAVDKIGNQILFLDTETYATTLTLDAFAPRVHELAISPDCVCPDLRRWDPRQEPTPWPSDRGDRSGGSAARR